MADYILQIPIKESEVANLKAGFIAANPMDTLIPIFDGEGEPTGEYDNFYSDIDWVRFKIKQYLDRESLKGLKKLRDNNDPISTDFFVEE